jgi:outer membrane protein assembly factor BamB
MKSVVVVLALSLLSTECKERGKGDEGGKGEVILKEKEVSFSPPVPISPSRPFGWRGDGTGRYPDATPVLEWSPTKNVKWTAPVGKSHSSPILTEKCVLVTSEPNLLICLDRASGKERWRQALRIVETYKAKDTGLTAATPVTDGTTVYAVLANGVVQAVDLDGRPKWSAYIDAEQNTSYGRSASPILFGGKLIVHMTNLYAFDPATGKPLWVNAEARCTYGTPLGWKDVIVTSGGDVVRLDDGKGLNSGVGPAFHTTPVEKDGVVTFGDKKICAVRFEAGWKDKEVWSGEMSADVFGSPLLHDGLVFTATGKGELYAFDAAGTAVISARELLGDDGGPDAVYSSLALAGKHLFLATNLGETVVLEATREAKVVARNKLKAGSGSTPVFSGSEMYLRDGETLYCIGR